MTAAANPVIPESVMRVIVGSPGVITEAVFKILAQQAAVTRGLVQKVCAIKSSVIQQNVALKAAAP